MDKHYANGICEKSACIEYDAKRMLKDFDAKRTANQVTKTPLFRGVIQRLLIMLISIFLLTPASCTEDKVVIVDPGGNNDTIVNRPYDPVPFSSVPATQDIVMYELNPKLFGSNNVFRNIIPRLDSIRALGVNVLWIMPIHPIGEINSVNSPYSVQNFTQVRSDLGTLNDFRDLVAASHERGMAVIMDWVANHTAWDNPWIENRSWYTQDESGNIIIPQGTNWQDVADLNFDNAQMRTAMIEALKFWVLNANIDGYRYDAADFVPFSFWREAISELDAIPGRRLIHLAEGARKDHITAGKHLTFGFRFYHYLKEVYINGQPTSKLYDAHLYEYQTLPPGAKVLRYSTNHDESAWDATPVSLFGGQQAALSAFVLVVSSGGVPLIYSSQEVGARGTVPFFNTFNLSWDQNREVTAMYRTIMGVYNGSNALRRGSVTFEGNNDVWLVIREAGQEVVAVLVNTRSTPSTIALPSKLANKNLIDQLTGTQFSLSNELEMTAHQYLIFKVE